MCSSLFHFVLLCVEFVRLQVVLDVNVFFVLSFCVLFCAEFVRLQVVLDVNVFFVLSFCVLFCAEFVRLQVVLECVLRSFILCFIL